MYEICIDEDGYYINGCEGVFVDVEDMPKVSDVRCLPAFKYDPDKKALYVDETRLDVIQASFDNITKPISREERLEALESAVFELINNTYGGE